MLWKGATAASHAEGDDPMIFQDHRSDTHFQDETTFNRWCEDFLKRWNALCTQRGEFDVTPILIIDGAPQHKYHILLAAGVKIVQVPYKQTHVFQPADQWIIAMLRSLLFQGWSDWVEAIFAQNDVIHAVKLLVVNSAPAIRKKKFELFSAALRKVSANCVLDSWERTGILRELFGKVLKEGKTVNSDDYRPQDREGADFVVQGDGAESAEEGEEEDRVVGTVPVVVTVSYTVEGLSAKGK